MADNATPREQAIDLYRGGGLGVRGSILVGSAVLLLFFFAFACIKLTYPDRFSTPDDPYYHARYAAHLAEGIPPPPAPYVSTMSWFGGGDLYTGYHAALALALRMGHAGDETQRIIVVSKLFHAFLSALILAVYAVVASRLAYQYLADVRRSIGVGLLSTMLLLLVFPDFAQRIFFERPHLVAIVCMLLVVDALIARAYVRVFGAVTFLTYAYSFSLLVLIPVGVQAMVTGCKEGVRGLRTEGMLFGSVIAGLVAGVLLHPHPYNYLYNAYGIILTTLYHSLIASGAVPAEITPFVIDPSDWMGILVTASVLLYWDALRHLFRVASLQPIVFLVGLTTVLAPLTIVFQRTIEYLAPIALLAATGIAVALYEQYRPAIYDVVRVLHPPQRRVLQGVLLLIIGCGMAVTFVALERIPSFFYGEYAEGVQAITERATEGDKVFLPSFGDYPQAMFYAPKLLYSQGMDPTFAYAADTSAYWLGLHVFSHPTMICAAPVCEQAEYTPHEVIAGVYGARFVLLSYKVTKEGAYGELPADAFIEALMQDGRFGVVYDTQSAEFRTIAFEVFGGMTNDPRP